MPNVVENAWREIWEKTPEELGGTRSYRTDFEVYDERAANHHNVVLDIYVGIKR
jgi:predicted transcriptional regulator YdeE